MHHTHSDHPLMLLAAGQPVPYATLQALATDLVRKIANGEPVAAALKLDRGQRVRQRDRHLAAAWQLLASEGDSDWNVAGKLAQAIRRHEATLHKRYLMVANNIEPDNELDAALHAAFCCGAGMMRCQRKLYEHFQSTG